MTKRSLQSANHLVRPNNGGPGIAAVFSFLGYAMWQNIQLLRIRNREKESVQEFVRRGAEIIEEHEKITSEIRSTFSL